LILELLAKVIIYTTKSMFKVLMLGLLLFLFVSYTNIGGSMDILKAKYESVTGNQMSRDEILLDLEEQVDDSLGNLNNVSTMMNQNNQNEN
jgi:hypothetical protein